jgi:hypothetical protein
MSATLPGKAYSKGSEIQNFKVVFVKKIKWQGNMPVI